jgi:Lar family restriction alleviation protein
MKYTMKPCPHCGGIPIISLLRVNRFITVKKVGLIDYDAVVCRECNSMSIGNTIEETINAWNRRKDDQGD